MPRFGQLGLKKYLYYLGTRCHCAKGGTGKQLFGAAVVTPGLFMSTSNGSTWKHTYHPKSWDVTTDTKVDSCFILLDSHFSGFFGFLDLNHLWVTPILGPIYKNAWSFKSHYVVSLVNFDEESYILTVLKIKFCHPPPWHVIRIFAPPDDVIHFVVSFCFYLFI